MNDAVEYGNYTIIPIRTLKFKREGFRYYVCKFRFYRFNRKSEALSPKFSSLELAKEWIRYTINMEYYDLKRKRKLLELTDKILINSKREE